MKKSQLKAVYLRTSMQIAVLLIITILVGGFYVTQNWLNDMAIRSNASSKINSNNLTPPELDLLKNEMSKQKTAIEKTSNIVTSKSNYKNKIQQDINQYASKNNISIANFRLTQQPADKSTSPIINGIKSNYIVVTIKNPVKFADFIKFIKGIETNIPKINLTGINISRKTDQDGYIKVEPLIMKFFMR